MHERYSNRELYFEEQAQTTLKFVIPFIEDVKKITPQTRVLEIGCGEGGNLKPFALLGCECAGVDLSEYRINLANEFFDKIPCRTKPVFIYKDMYDTTKEELGDFDVIIMRDVIEHIFNQEKFLVFIKQFLKDDGVIFFGFPPWQMPYGGHQQVASTKWVRRMPFLHLLPMKAYRYVLKKMGESSGTIEEFTDIKKTGISMERFEKAIKNAGYGFKKKTPYFINPNYETKFKLKPRKKIPLLGDIPYIRNFVTTCLYALVGKEII